MNIKVLSRACWYSRVQYNRSNVGFCPPQRTSSLPKFYSGVLRAPGVNPAHPDIHIHPVQTKPGTKLQVTRPRSRYTRKSIGSSEQCLGAVAYNKCDQWRSHWVKGRVPLLTAKKLPKIGNKRKKSEIKGKNREVYFTLPPPPDR